MSGRGVGGPIPNGRSLGHLPAAPRSGAAHPAHPAHLAPNGRGSGWPSGAERPVVGFIGLGRMGAPMARAIRRAGFDLVVFDARAEATEPLVADGAVAAESAPGAAASCDVLLTKLPGPAQVELLMAGRGGAFQALREGSVWVDLTTSTPAAARSLAREGEPRGVAVVDAPVVGLVDAAEAGSLRVFAGGSPADVARVRPVLEAMGGPAGVTHVGPRGSGYVVKLCVNLYAYIQAAAGAEVLVLGAKAGVDVETLRDALAGGPATTDPFRRELDRVLAGDYDERITLDVVTKDLALAVDLGRDVGVPLELGALVEQLHRRARAMYGDRAGRLSAVRMAEDEAGIRLRPAGGRR